MNFSYDTCFAVSRSNEFGLMSKSHSAQECRFTLCASGINTIDAVKLYYITGLSAVHALPDVCVCIANMISTGMCDVSANSCEYVDFLLNITSYLNDTRNFFNDFYAKAENIDIRNMMYDKIYEMSPAHALSQRIPEFRFRILESLFSRFPNLLVKFYALDPKRCGGEYPDFVDWLFRKCKDRAAAESDFAGVFRDMQHMRQYAANLNSFLN